MKNSSHPAPDPLDELLAAAVHGELTAAQRAELDARLQTDPAARAAYQEIQHMHDLLDRNHREAQPDAAFEERLISGVRRKTRADKARRETPWESALFLWRAVKWPFVQRPGWTFATLGLICALAIIGLIHNGQQVRGVFAAINSRALLVPASTEQAVDNSSQNMAALEPSQIRLTLAQKEKNREDLTQGFDADGTSKAKKDLDKYLAINDAERPSNAATASSGPLPAAPSAPPTSMPAQPPAPFHAQALADTQKELEAPTLAPTATSTTVDMNAPRASDLAMASAMPVARAAAEVQEDGVLASGGIADSAHAQRQGIAQTETDGKYKTISDASGTVISTAIPAGQPSRKLVRDAQLDLEVKSYQPAVDAITALAKAGGGYLDSSNSQRGGNGKLQGSVIVKVLPENLDALLLKLRDLGEIKNQSVSTEDVTKDYYDTQARLDNSRRMETQLQLLLAHDNGKVADLLQVERELGRVRGDIEQMQGQLKLYDFQVQYATVTITVAEKDLHEAAAYLLRESDAFSLFVGNVEDAFGQARAAADAFKGEILNANLEHDSDNTLSATLAFSVPPDQIDGFLARVRALGRVDNFTRQTQRVANDGGDPSEPSDQTRTEKDRVQVQLTIHADDESPRQQTQLAIVSTGDIDGQAQQLKDGAAAAGAAVTASNFQRATDGTETATLSFRLALARIGGFTAALEKLGRVESLTVQRNDRPDQAAADPGAPAEIDLTLHNVPAVRVEDQPPRQQTQLAVVSLGGVDAQAQQLKSDALKAGFTITASTFQRATDGTEQAAMTFRLPLAQAAAFTATLEKLGKVESLAVQRNDVPGPNSIDPNAPAEISLDLHNEPALVAENRGFWPTLRNTFGGGIAAFLGSVQVIGVVVAFLLPWVAVVAAVAWGGRRIYIARRAKRAA